MENFLDTRPQNFFREARSRPLKEALNSERVQKREFDFQKMGKIEKSLNKNAKNDK